MSYQWFNRLSRYVEENVRDVQELTVVFIKIVRDERVASRHDVIEHLPGAGVHPSRGRKRGEVGHRAPGN